MVFCTECGTENPPEAKFCSNCGNLLKEVMTRPLKTTEVIQEEKLEIDNLKSNLVCPVCLSKNTNNNGICPKCGKNLKETLFYFEGHGSKMRYDIEITPTSLIKYKKGRFNDKRTGKVKTYDRDLMKNIGIIPRYSQLMFKYKGKYVKLAFLKENIDEVKEILVGRKITIEKSIEKDGKLQKIVSDYYNYSFRRI